MHKLALVAVVLGSGGVASAAPKTTLDLGAPVVTGKLDAGAVVKVVKASKSKLVGCYDKQHAKLADVDGAASVTFTIGSTGKVTAAAATGLNDAAHACIVTTITKLKFAKPADGAPVEVTYPLEFSRVPVARTSGILGSTALRDGTAYGGLLGTDHDASGWGTFGTGRGMRGRTSGAPTISIGQPTATGDLDKAIIRRYIKRNIYKLQYCYEKELLATPGITGTVTVAFTIGADGLVSASSASGISNTNVETCMANVIKAIEFPRPKTGEVVVGYPLTVDPGTSSFATPAPAK